MITCNNLFWVPTDKKEKKGRTLRRGPCPARSEGSVEVTETRSLSRLLHERPQLELLTRQKTYVL